MLGINGLTWGGLGKVRAPMRAVESVEKTCTARLRCDGWVSAEHSITGAPTSFKTEKGAVARRWRRLSVVMDEGDNEHVRWVAQRALRPCRRVWPSEGSPIAHAARPRAPQQVAGRVRVQWSTWKGVRRVGAGRTQPRF